jgi:hypothetical protein
MNQLATGASMGNTSVGRGPASGGNENHDGDPRHTTMGEAVQQERPAGNVVQEDADPGVPAAPPLPQVDSGKVPPA